MADEEKIDAATAERRAPLDEPDASDGTAHFETYQEYNKVLRTWFVAFGIGGPALFLVNPPIANRLAESRQLGFVAGAFLVGAGAQVVGALVNKVASWCVYKGELHDTQASISYRVASLVSEQFWFDVVLDLVTVLSFGMAVCRLFLVFAH